MPEECALLAPESLLFVFSLLSKAIPCFVNKKEEDIALPVMAALSFCEKVYSSTVASYLGNSSSQLP